MEGGVNPHVRSPSSMLQGAQLSMSGGQSQIPAELSVGAQLNMPDGQSEVPAESLIRANQSSPDSYEARRLGWLGDKLISIS